MPSGESCSILNEDLDGGFIKTSVYINYFLKSRIKRLLHGVDISYKDTTMLE